MKGTPAAETGTVTFIFRVEIKGAVSFKFAKYEISSTLV